MKYVKATTVFPEELLVEIQKYVQGETIYIPKQKCTYQNIIVENLMIYICIPC